MALEEFTSGGARDFRQRYLEVYGFFPVDKREVLVRVTEVNDNRMSFVDERGIQYSAYADKGVFFRFIPVTKRLFIHNDNLYLAFRKPARQYKRGITYENTTFVSMSGGNADVDFETVLSYNNSRQVRSAKNCKILTDFLGVYEGSLFLYNQVIGTINDKTAYLSIPIFRQEVLDALRINGMKQEVIV